MIVKEGFNGEELEIKISGRGDSDTFELWLIQNGLPETINRYKETLSYMTLDEAVALKREIEKAIKDQLF